MFIYVTVSYALELYFEVNFGVPFDHTEIIGKTLSFLLVFRANAAYERYWDGRRCCAMFFADLRNMVMYGSVQLKGGTGQHMWNRRYGEDGFSATRKRGMENADDQRASAARVDLVRWALALAIAFKIHTRLCAEGYFWGRVDEDLKWRLNWDRMRLRTLMTAEEFEIVDRALRIEDTDREMRMLWEQTSACPQAFHRKCLFELFENRPITFEVDKEPSCRQLLVVLALFMQALFNHVNEPYGYKERFFPDLVTVSSELMRTQDRVHQAMVTPLPLPYVHLVRTLLILWLLSAPFFIDYEDGLWGNVVMPTVAAFALFGIDQIGTELENPFGDDANDLDLQEMIMTLERELLRLLELGGDQAARESFTWLPVPKYIQEESSKPFAWYMALRSEVGAVFAPHDNHGHGVRVRTAMLAPVRAGSHPRGELAPMATSLSTNPFGKG